MMIPTTFQKLISFEKTGLIQCLLRTYSSSDYQSHLHFVKSYFDLQHYKAKDFLEFSKIESYPLQDVIASAKHYENLGFPKQALVVLPQLLRYPPHILQSHTDYLNEAQIQLTPLTISKWRTVIKTPLSILKAKRWMDKDADTVGGFMDSLDIPLDDLKLSKVSENLSPAEIHFQILSEYLKSRLQIDDYQFQKLVTTHTGIKNRPFCHICEILRIAEDLHLTREKILKSGYILRAYPAYVKILLKNHGNLAGADLKTKIRHYPKLMTVMPPHVDSIYNFLKKCSITDEQIQRCMPIFCLSPETVVRRIREIERIPDFHVLRNELYFLTLVLSHYNARSRLAYLKELEMKCVHIKVLGLEKQFEDHVKEGSDANKFRSLCKFLQDILKVPREKFDTILKRHHLHSRVCYTDIESTLNYLRQRHFTNKNIAAAIHILLYPREKIRDALVDVEALEKERNETFDRVTQLNLALYFIEKEHHFNGDGIWVKEDYHIDASL